MMQPAHSARWPWNHRNRRLDPRWPDRRFALARNGLEEHFGVTGDVSLGGMRLGLVNASLEEGDVLSVSVAFTHDVVALVGQVLHACPAPWGCIAGVRYLDIPEGFPDYLNRRYPNA